MSKIHLETKSNWNYSPNSFIDFIQRMYACELANGKKEFPFPSLVQFLYILLLKWALQGVECDLRVPGDMLSR